MKKKNIYLLIGAGVIGLLLMARPAWYTITDWLLPKFEGFLPHPKWDYRQYTWGYGTRAPGPTGTITREQALEEMRQYLWNDYHYLSKLISRPLNGHQWAALLSFSYNLGRGNADNLVNNINSGNDAALKTQWLLYDMAGGMHDPDILERRELEWNIWEGKI